ncbi:MAG: squalene synthase HpnD [Pedosphaera sp.]|nr:squalene synthase HpnD [Pedosphaera sp.]MST00941.1 squalene synthase HpnD [Pedosphaera sp.]
MQASETITRKSASNLALAFCLLPREKRLAMSALYAFCREVDDVADEETRPVAERRAALSEWREDVRAACDGGKPKFVVNRELQAVIHRHGLRFEFFDQLIRGCEMDLDTFRYASHAQLDLYCHRVASAVGLLSIEIFGYSDPRCRDYAIHLGKALQLTNILRDVRNDAERGRIYLPQDVLVLHGVKEEEILRGEYTPRFRALAEGVAARARGHYAQARELLPATDRRAMVAAELMGSVYWRLLCKLEKQHFDVFGPRLTRLNKLQKLLLIARTWLRLAAGVSTPNYGVS